MSHYYENLKEHLENPYKQRTTNHRYFVAYQQDQQQTFIDSNPPSHHFDPPSHHFDPQCRHHYSHYSQCPHSSCQLRAEFERDPVACFLLMLFLLLLLVLEEIKPGLGVIPLFVIFLLGFIYKTCYKLN